MSRRVRAGAFALAVAAMAAGASVALADVDITAHPTENEYTQAVFEMDQGERARLVHQGGAPHDVIASRRGPDGRALFRSRLISSGSAPVLGTEYLSGGDYAFFCSIHAGMTATLRVASDKGTPAARPNFRVKILSRRLGRVRRTGRLVVRLRGLADAAGIKLVARRGERFVGRRAGIRLAAGQVKVIRIKVGRRGRAALRGRRAFVRVFGSVPFGKFRRDGRRLR